MGSLITEIIVIIVVITITIIFYSVAKNENVNKYVNEQFNNTPLNIIPNHNIDPVYDGVIYDKNEPLDKNIFIQQMTYADRKQDSRTDEIIKTLDGILFWVRIIGLYVLIKLLIAIIKLLAGVTAGAYILEILNNLL